MSSAHEHHRSSGRDPFDQEDFSEFMDSMASDAKQYWEAQKDYYALVASEKAARAGGGLMSAVVMALLLGSVLVFCNLALALWLGGLLGNMALGFLITGGFYLVLLVVFLLLWRGGLRDRFTLNIINTLHDGKD